MKYIIRILLYILLLVAVHYGTEIFSPKVGAQPVANYKMDLLTGSCDGSHLAHGLVGSDLTKKQVPFACNTVMIKYFDDGNVEIHFFLKTGNSKMFGFHGNLDASMRMMHVNMVYLAPDETTYVDNGECKLFYKDGDKNYQIFCGAVIDSDGERNVAVITFVGQKLSPM
jgi:hypothetical protein